MLTEFSFNTARRTVSAAIHRTPLLSFRTLGAPSGTKVRLKCENLQKTGSFKVRGALNAITGAESGRAWPWRDHDLGGEPRAGGGWAARRVGARAVVVMPETASRTKVAAARGYGAQVALHGDAAAAFAEARRRADEEGLVFLHPFDAPEVIAGHGSTGLEIAEDIAGPRRLLSRWAEAGRLPV